MLVINDNLIKISEEKTKFDEFEKNNKLKKIKNHVLIQGLGIKYRKEGFNSINKILYLVDKKAAILNDSIN